MSSPVSSSDSRWVVGDTSVIFSGVIRTLLCVYPTSISRCSDQFDAILSFPLRSLDPLSGRSSKGLIMLTSSRFGRTNCKCARFY